MKRAQVVVGTVVALALGVCGCARHSAQTGEFFDWPCWRGPDGNGISRETDWDATALAGGPRVLWKAQVGWGYSNVAIKGGRLYTVGAAREGNTVSCLDAAGGRTIWQYSFDDPDEAQGTPAIDEASVYVLTKKGMIVSLNARTGRVRWQKDLVAEYGALKPFYGFAGSPMVDGDLLILNVNTAGMALKKTNGRLVWGSEVPPARLLKEIRDDNGATYMTPVRYAYGGKRCALVYSWKGLHALEVQTGRVLWLYAWEHYNLNKTPDPVLLGDKVFIADESTSVQRERLCTLLEIVEGLPGVLWKSPDLFSDVTSPIVLDGYVYGANGGPYSISPRSSLRCLELASGRLMWEQDLAQFGGGLRPTWISLAAADGKLIFLTDRGSLYIAEASPEGFKVISSCDVMAGENRPGKFCTPPVLCNGRIYCRDFAGDLICIDVRR